MSNLARLSDSSDCFAELARLPRARSRAHLDRSDRTAAFRTSSCRNSRNVAVFMWTPAPIFGSMAEFDDISCRTCHAYGELATSLDAFRNRPTLYEHGEAAREILDLGEGQRGSDCSRSEASDAILDHAWFRRCNEIARCAVFGGLIPSRH